MFCQIDRTKSCDLKRKLAMKKMFSLAALGMAALGTTLWAQQSEEPPPAEAPPARSVAAAQEDEAFLQDTELFRRRRYENREPLHRISQTRELLHRTDRKETGALIADRLARRAAYLSRICRHCQIMVTSICWPCSTGVGASIDLSAKQLAFAQLSRKRRSSLLRSQRYATDQQTVERRI